MTNKILIKLSLAVVIAAMNISIAFCQVGIVDVVFRQSSGEKKEISISPLTDGETEITVVQNGQVVFETAIPQFATIPLHLTSGIYRIVATNRLTACREIRLLQLED